VRLAPSGELERFELKRLVRLRATGVPRRAGANGGRPRASLSALVSALTTVAATARARTDVNFIMFCSFGLRGMRDLDRRQRNLRKVEKGQVG
jgi:hypothetical protein